MKSIISVFFAILAVFAATTAFAKKAEIPVLPEDFRLDTLMNGEQILWTPFAEVPVFSSNLGDRSVIGKFTVVDWDPMSRILKLVTNEGEEVRFSEIDDNRWYFVNYVDGAMGPGKKLTRVGLKTAAAMFNSSPYINGRICPDAEKRKISVVDAAGRHLWTEELLIPLGDGYGVVCLEKWIILILPEGENFSDDSLMGREENRYMAFYPRVFKNEKVEPGWSYIIGSTQSGFAGTIAENLGGFLK